MDRQSGPVQMESGPPIMQGLQYIATEPPAWAKTAGSVIHYLMNDFGGGRRRLKLSWVINFQKLATIPLLAIFIFKYRLFEINVMSGVRLSRHYFAAMLERNWGRILFVSSESGVQIPAEMVHYGMTKTNSKSRRTNRVEQWREARSWLQKSLKLWTIMRENGSLPGSKASEPDKIAQQITRCDGELERFTAKLPGPPKN